MRTKTIALAVVGIAAANPAPAPTEAASLDTRASSCDIDYDLGRPVQIPASIKSWMRTARPPNECTDVMPASLTSGWMAYLGQLSSFVAHAPEKTASLTDLCGSTAYTVSIAFCSTQGKIVVTDGDSGETVTTISNTVRDPGAVVLTSKNGKIGVASAAATATATATSEESESESTPASTGRSSSSSSAAAKTSSKGSALATTSAATTSGGASQTSVTVSSTGTDKPKNNAAGQIGAGVAAIAAGVAALAF
ncbi:hypothetical protein V2A60_004141 [Cordyceps javanica]|uniref:Uncharacterized protein n=1 Tax=Cordyceps javanica TaxID=43265 RepID=A0A545VKN8_9HYPO|nr:hypothetical protein IF1G_07422 [Cordyceps javanica]TQW02298.1 hypothetical protein IF2G_10101 [Cordyceps javanica]